jgi:hypothetical protein
MPTITNDKAAVQIGAINTDSFASNINRSDPKYKNLKDDEKNNGYASGRIETITDFIRTGKMAQLQSGQDVEVKKSIAVITDTGPCDDEHRDTLPIYIDGIQIKDFIDGRYSDGLDGGTRLYTIEIKQNTPLWNSVMANATKFGNHIRISYQGFASSWYAGKKIYAAGARTVKFGDQFIGPAKDSNNNDVQSHSSAVYLDITLTRSDNTLDNVKGWTKNGARGTEKVTIADLIPCTKESSQRITLG